MPFPTARGVHVTLLVVLLVMPGLDAASHVKGYTKKNGTYVAPHERKTSSKGGTPRSPSAKKGKTEKPRTAATRGGGARDEKGRIQRSDAARHAFARRTGYPNGRPGYVIDHIKPLACGGADTPENMQWQTVAQAKWKDRYERKGC